MFALPLPDGFYFGAKQLYPGNKLIQYMILKVGFFYSLYRYSGPLVQRCKLFYCRLNNQYGYIHQVPYRVYRCTKDEVF